MALYHTRLPAGYRFTPSACLPDACNAVSIFCSDPAVTSTCQLYGAQRLATNTASNLWSIGSGLPTSVVARASGRGITAITNWRLLTLKSGDGSVDLGPFVKIYTFVFEDASTIWLLAAGNNLINPPIIGGTLMCFQLYDGFNNVWRLSASKSLPMAKGDLTETAYSVAGRWEDLTADPLNTKDTFVLYATTKTRVFRYIPATDALDTIFDVDSPTSGLSGQWYAVRGVAMPPLSAEACLPTADPTATASGTSTGSASITRTASSSVTSTSSASISATASNSVTSTASASVTRTASSSITGTASASYTRTASSSLTRTASSSITRTASSSVTRTSSASHTRTSSSSHTGTPSSSVTRTSSASHTGTASSSHTRTSSASHTRTASSSRTGTASASVTRSSGATATPTATSTSSSSQTASMSPAPSNNTCICPEYEDDDWEESGDDDNDGSRSGSGDDDSDGSRSGSGDDDGSHSRRRLEGDDDGNSGSGDDDNDRRSSGGSGDDDNDGSSGSSSGDHEDEANECECPKPTRRPTRTPKPTPSRTPVKRVDDDKDGDGSSLRGGGDYGKKKAWDGGKEYDGSFR